MLRLDIKGSDGAGFDVDVDDWDDVNVDIVL